MTKQQRSPKYPFITLEKAVMRAQQFYDAEVAHEASVPVSLTSWGYGPKSSGGLQTIGALVGYGLLEDKGSGDSRRLKLSDRATRILLDNRPNSPERKKFIKDAFLSPKIFSELWDEWGGRDLPSSANMEHTLIFSKNFPQKGVGDFIKIFLSNIEFTEISNSTDNYPDNPDFDASPVDEEVDSLYNEPVKEEKLTAGSNMKKDTLDLDEGMALLQWPANISKSSFDEIKDWLDFQVKRMEKRANKADNDSQK